MSIWTDLLSLHGHLSHLPHSPATTKVSARPTEAEDADRLRELWGCRSATAQPEPRPPIPGVRGLA
jgi:hypothetical protein